MDFFTPLKQLARIYHSLSDPETSSEGRYEGDLVIQFKELTSV